MRGPRGLHRIIDEEAGELLHEAARADGVHMHYGEEVDEFVRSNGAITKVRTTKGQEIEAQCYALRFRVGDEYRTLRRHRDRDE